MTFYLAFVTILLAVAFWLQSSALYGSEIIKTSHHAAASSRLSEPAISFSQTWQVLGPFRCGTREAVWGADPLEYWGGFSNLLYDEDSGYNSPLATSGIARWSLAWANSSNPTTEQSKAEFEVSFPEIKWDFLQSIYGWSASQYQAWVRGNLQLNGPKYQTVAIFPNGILEFSVDGRRHFGGDFYGYSRAPLILNLAPGEHVIELRLVRDVRSLGGIGEPTISVAIEAEIRHEILTVDEQSLLIPETTNGNLGSTWASINVQNNVANPVEILSIGSSDGMPLTLRETLNVSGYQTRPLAFQIGTSRSLKAEFPVDIVYRTVQDREIPRVVTFEVKLNRRSTFEPQRLTYLHPANIVSYAIIRPPLGTGCSANHVNHSIPVIIGLHGAGLEADSIQVREMLNAAYGLCAWMLFPSGVTSWSGDDWHTWGAVDIKAAVNAVSQWITLTEWTGPQISPDSWIAIGHSNGGQGVWFLATHYPDNIIAVAPVSAYSSIENYVPYTMWQESEPLLSSVLQQSRSSFKHELLLGNIAGIPILQQHGSDDTNVPAYHSRLMHELLEKAGWPSAYDELPGKDHWFDGVMTTPSLLKFYNDSVRVSESTIPPNYTINVPSSGDMSSKGGVYVDQLQTPDINGQIKVRRLPDSGVMVVQTHNIYRFHLSDKLCQTGFPLMLEIDSIDMPFKVDLNQCESTWFVKDSKGKWELSKNTSWQSLSQRYGRQVGAIDAILHSEGLFTIAMSSAGIEYIALQISRNLLQYFAGDSQIIRESSLEGKEYRSGNVITLALGDELPSSEHQSFPIRVGGGRISLFTASQGFRSPEIDPRITSLHNYTYVYEKGIGAIFLRPLENQRLELVVWGSDISGLEQAARLVPTLTGVGQPEFLILGDSCRWKGHAGLYAAGHFDKFWQISPGSYITTRL